MNSTPRRADSQCRNVAATTGQGRQTHCIPHQAGKENKQQAHTPARLTPATLPTHASPATASDPTTALASNSSTGPSRALQVTWSHGQETQHKEKHPLGTHTAGRGATITVRKQLHSRAGTERCTVAWEGNFPAFSYKARAECNTKPGWFEGQSWKEADFGPLQSTPDAQAFILPQETTPTAVKQLFSGMWSLLHPILTLYSPPRNRFDCHCTLSCSPTALTPHYLHHKHEKTDSVYKNSMHKELKQWDRGLC